MKKAFLIFCFVGLVVLGLSGMSFGVDMGIMTGGQKGTYYQFGLNLQELVKSKDIRLKVNNSTGSIENLYAVYKRPHTQMGIVQSDVLAFVSRLQSDPILKRIASKTKMVFPLYNEEIHLLGRRDLTDFDALEGKRVAIGKEGSGTYLTAKLLFEVSDVKPATMVSVGTDEALAKLKGGDIDAMFYVAGFPVKLFEADVTADDGLALIPITNTVAVKAVLVSFNFRRANCEHVGKFAQILNENMDWLKKNGHPKWNYVDLEFPLKGWEQYDCVKKYLVKKPKAAPKPPADINPILKAVKDILK